jgi:hypothetical protein
VLPNLGRLRTQRRAGLELVFVSRLTYSRQSHPIGQLVSRLWMGWGIESVEKGM